MQSSSSGSTARTVVYRIDSVVVSMEYETLGESEWLNRDPVWMKLYPEAVLG